MQDPTHHGPAMLALALLATASLPMAAAHAQTETVISHLASGASNAETGLLSDAAGNLYGTTQGVNGAGAVAFELSPPATSGGSWSWTTLAEMGSATKLGVAVGDLIPNGKGGFYGASIWNKAPKSKKCPHFGGCGVVFDIKAPTKHSTSWTSSVLAQFNYGSSILLEPQGPVLAGQGGVLYGLIQGGTSGQGAAYALTPPTPGSPGWKLADIYDFSCGTGFCTNGAFPVGNLVQDSAGALYGISPTGGQSCAQNSNGCGVVFKLTPGTGGSWSEQVIYTFTGGGDGGLPLAGLLLDKNGNLFGTTSQGGYFGCAVYTTTKGCGTVFELSPGAGGWTETTLYAFGGPADSDAAFPESTLIMDAAGALYGVTAVGGPTSAGCSNSGVLIGCGTVFKLTPQPDGTWAESVLHSFFAGGSGGNTDVYFPNGPLALGPDGSTLYGTGFNGIFQITQ